MHQSFILASIAAGLVAAQGSTTVVITDGITTSYALPDWTAGTSPTGEASPTTTLLESVTVTVSGVSSAGTAGRPTTLTVVPSAIPSGSVWGPPPFGQSTFTSAVGTGTTPAVVGPTGSANGTATAPATVPTAAADHPAVYKASLLVALAATLLTL